jgi:hypothetical protein
MFLRTFCGTAATLLILPGVSQAEFNYTTAEFNYVDVDADIGPVNVDGDGFGIAGTYTVADSFYVGASYEDYDFDYGVDGSVLEIGGGYFHTLQDDLDFIATFSYLEADASAGSQSADDDGFQIGGGIRARLADSVEVDALLELVDMNEGDSDTGIELRGRYYISDEFAVQAKASFGTNFDTISIGVRGEF